MTPELPPFFNSLVVWSRNKKRFMQVGNDRHVFSVWKRVDDEDEIDGSWFRGDPYKFIEGKLFYELYHAVSEREIIVPEDI